LTMENKNAGNATIKLCIDQLHRCQGILKD
jgi:hypothetical protein